MMKPRSTADEAEAALDHKAAEVLKSSESTDAEVIDALKTGLALGKAHLERSRKDLGVAEKRWRKRIGR